MWCTEFLAAVRKCTFEEIIRKLETMIKQHRDARTHSSLFPLLIEVPLVAEVRSLQANLPDLQSCQGET